MRVLLDAKIDALELQFEQANKTYVESTAQQTVRFKQLTEQDLQNAKTIETNARKLQRLQDALNHWRYILFYSLLPFAHFQYRAKLTTNMRECEERNRALKEEKDAVAAHFQELKGKMNRFRETQQKRLVTLTKHVDCTLRELNQKVQKAEKILALSEMNSKMETEEEGLLSLRPAITQTVLGQQEEEKEGGSDANEEEAELGAHTTTATTKAGRRVKEWDYLGNFFRKVNKVTLDKLALERERARLEQENSDLRTILKQYLDGISVNDDALRNPNPLLIVNQPTTANSPVTVSPQQVLQYQRV